MAHNGDQAATIHPCLDGFEAVSAIESAGLASTATFASALWVGLALPGLPLLPGLGAGGNSNVAISLSSAVLGVQESQTFKSPNNVTGRQARLLSLLLPADALANDLATASPRSAELPRQVADRRTSGSTCRGESRRVARARPTSRSGRSRLRRSSSLSPRHNRLRPHRLHLTRRRLQRRVSSSRTRTPRRPGPPLLRLHLRRPTPESRWSPPPLADGGEGPLPADPGAPESPESPDPAGDPGSGNPDAGGATTNPGGNGNGNGSGNGNAGGSNPNAGGNNPNAGGNNAGGNGNGNGNAGGNNPSAGGNNPNAGGNNAGGNGNGNGNAGGNNPNAGGNNPNAGGNNPNAGGNNPNARRQQRRRQRKRERQRGWKQPERRGRERWG